MFLYPPYDVIYSFIDRWKNYLVTFNFCVTNSGTLKLQCYLEKVVIACCAGPGPAASAHLYLATFQCAAALTMYHFKMDERGGRLSLTLLFTLSFSITVVSCGSIFVQVTKSV